MTTFDFPAEIMAVFHEFRTCEFSTLARDGTPITWPVTPLFRPETGRFYVATSIGLPQKAFNIRRNPRVALLFSDPTASGLTDPPAVLVQGDAVAPDEMITSLSESKDFADLARVIFPRQPVGKMYSSNPLLRYLFDWYYVRLPIYVTPRRILWWDHGDFTRRPHEMEMPITQPPSVIARNGA